MASNQIQRGAQWRFSLRPLLHDPALGSVEKKTATLLPRSDDSAVQRRRAAEARLRDFGEEAVNCGAAGEWPNDAPRWKPLGPSALSVKFPLSQRAHHRRVRPATAPPPPAPRCSTPAARDQGRRQGSLEGQSVGTPQQQRQLLS